MSSCVLVAGTLPVTVACATLLVCAEPVPRALVVRCWTLGLILGVTLAMWTGRRVRRSMARASAEFCRVSMDLASAAKKTAEELTNLRTRLERRGTRNRRNIGSPWN